MEQDAKLQPRSKKKITITSVSAGIIFGLIYAWTSRPYVGGFKWDIGQYFMFLTKFFEGDIDGKIARTLTGHLFTWVLAGLIAGLAFSVLINTIQEKK